MKNKYWVHEIRINRKGRALKRFRSGWRVGGLWEMRANGELIFLGIGRIKPCQQGL